MIDVRSFPSGIDPNFLDTPESSARPESTFINSWLEGARNDWTEMPLLEKQVRNANKDDRYELVIDLPVVYGPIMNLNYWHKQGYMTEDQEEKWDKVLELMERNYASFEYLHKIATGEEE